MEAFAAEWTEWIVHKVMFWETDPVRKGKLLRWAHHSAVNISFFLIVISHTLYPAFWLQSIMLFGWLLVWLQHVTCNGCVLGKVENKLIGGDPTGFFDPVYDIFRVTPTPELRDMIVILGSTLIVSFLGLEWLARIHHKLIPLVAEIWLRVKQNGIVYTQE